MLGIVLLCSDMGESELLLSYIDHIFVSAVLLGLTIRLCEIEFQLALRHYAGNVRVASEDWFHYEQELMSMTSVLTATVMFADANSRMMQ